MPPIFEDDSDRKMCIIVSKGTLDWATAAMVLGNAAVTEGIELHLFFTFYGMDVITNKKLDNLKVTPLANPAMGMPNMVAGLPGITALASKMMKKQMDEQAVPPSREFLQMVADGGAHLHACRLSYDMFGLTEEDLFPEVEDVISANDFMELSEGAQIIFI
jgi:peroxiredoxin family protein